MWNWRMTTREWMNTTKESTSNFLFSPSGDMHGFTESSPTRHQSPFRIGKCGGKTRARRYEFKERWFVSPLRQLQSHQLSSLSSDESPNEDSCFDAHSKSQRQQQLKDRHRTRDKVPRPFLVLRISPFHSVSRPTLAPDPSSHPRHLLIDLQTYPF